MPQRNAYIEELRRYDNPKNPAASPYDVILPPTISDAVIVPSDGKSVTTHLANKVNVSVFNEAVGSLSENKADITRPVLFLPELITSDGNQDFNYSSRIGHYTLIGDRCFWDFDLNISNLSTSQATGTLSLKMPVPYARIPTFDYISQFLILNEQYAGTILIANGDLGISRLDGTTSLLDMSYIDKSFVGDTALRGTFNYYWR